MALVKCSECGREISDQATSCPNCGRPMGQPAKTLVQFDVAPEKRRKYKKRYLVFGLLALLGALIMIFSSLSRNIAMAGFGFIIVSIGFIGMFVSRIGYWLNKP